MLLKGYWIIQKVTVIGLDIYLNPLPGRAAVADVVMSEDEDPVIAEVLRHLLVGAADVLAEPVAQKDPGANLSRWGRLPVGCRESAFPLVLHREGGRLLREGSAFSFQSEFDFTVSLVSGKGNCSFFRSLHFSNRLNHKIKIKFSNFSKFVSNRYLSLTANYKYRSVANNNNSPYTSVNYHHH